MDLKKLRKGFVSKNYFTVFEKKQIMKALKDYRLYPHRIIKFNADEDDKLIKYLCKGIRNGKKI